MYTFNVEGMHCGGCARAITRAIQKRDPEAKVAVRIQEKLVEVATDELGAEDVSGAINEAGYQVR